MQQKLHQGQIVELEITDLNSKGEGVGRYQGQVIFVPDTVTGDRLQAKIIYSKAKFAQGKIQRLLTSSPHRIRPSCIVADKCGGCQWQHIAPAYQRLAKGQQVTQALQRIARFADIGVAPVLHHADGFNYRNKSTYPLGRAASGQIQAGYYRRGSHKLVNLNQCPVQDQRLNPLLKEIKQDIQQQGWSIYQESGHRGKLRHLSLRIGQNTGEMLLTLISTSAKLPGLEEQAQLWLERYRNLVGVGININQAHTNKILGSTTHTIAGKPYLREIFDGIELHIAADTFFQVNTHAAELLLQEIKCRLNLSGQETLLDLYCGIGTFTLPLARHVAQAIGIEINPSSIQQAKQNATLNQVDNVTFYAGKVKQSLAQIELRPDIVLLDPPRKGCAPEVIAQILQLQPAQIAYISCKPSTLARDLQGLCQDGLYHLVHVQPVDFFPQTTHVESFVLLSKTK